MFLSQTAKNYPEQRLAADEWFVLLLPPATLAFPHAAWVCLIAIGAVLLVRRRSEHRIIFTEMAVLARSPFAAATGLFFLWMALSILWSPVPATSATRLLTTLVMAATTMFLIAAVRTERLSGERAFRLMSAMALACALLTALLTVTQMRLIGMLLDIQILDRQFHRIALVLVLLLPFVMAHRGFGVLLRIGLSLPLIGAIFMTTSETAKLAVMIAVASFFFAAVAWRAAIFLLASLIVPTIPLTPWLLPLLQTAIPRELIAMLADAHPVERLLIWREYALVVPLRPLLGWGLESSRVVLDQIDPNMFARLNFTPVPNNHPHNQILQLWLELGGVGVALFCAALVAALHRICAMPPAIRTAAISLAATLFTISTIRHGVWQSWWVALVCAMLVVAVGLERREREATV